MRASAFLTIVSVALVGLGAGAPGLAAQRARPAEAPLPRPIHAPLPPDTTPEGGASWERRVLTALGAAALGAGAGFFASQINQSDWEDIPGVDHGRRNTWAAVGGSLGFAVGLSFPLGGRRGAPGQAPPGVRRPSLAVITAQEIHDAVASDAYEAVRLLRPQWLVPRQADVLGDAPQQTLPVYLDDFRLGDIESLRGVSAQTIESIRLLSAGVATTRWGVGHNHGAIQVITTG